MAEWEAAGHTLYHPYTYTVTPVYAFLCFFNYFPTDGTVPLSKIPLQEKTSLKQLRFMLSHQRGAKWPARFLLSHPEGFLSKDSSIKQWESTRLCTSNLLYCRTGWDLVGGWVLIHTNPCSIFPWSFGPYHCWRWDTGLDRPRVWPCLAIPMGSNWETSQEASVCPKIYYQGCDVSNWMNAIKSADSFSSVMCGISIAFSVTVLHPIKTHWIENTVVEITLCSW